MSSPGIKPISTMHQTPLPDKSLGFLRIKSEPIAIGALERFVGDNTEAADVEIK